MERVDLLIGIDDFVVISSFGFDLYFCCDFYFIFILIVCLSCVYIFSFSCIFICSFCDENLEISLLLFEGSDIESLLLYSLLEIR